MKKKKMKSIFINLKNINLAFFYNFALYIKKLLFIQIKTMHSKLNYEDSLVIPLIVYNNIEIEKITILKDNKGKTGIYR